jgi:adenosylcobyric acid synthase
VVKPSLGRDVLRVAVVRFGRISNFTDFDALAHEPGVSVRFTESAEELMEADLAILPGTKATVDDLKNLRSSGLEKALIKRSKRELPILGICGGYQMLGGRIKDGIESLETSIRGLGLLPIETIFESDKVLGRPEGITLDFDDTPVAGYEIHHGRTNRTGGSPLFTGPDLEEGCATGNTLGTSWHGVLESDDFRRAYLSRIAEARGLDWQPGEETFAAAREAQYEALGDLIAENVDREVMMRWIQTGPPSGLPTIQSKVSTPSFDEATSEREPALISGPTNPKVDA